MNDFKHKVETRKQLKQVGPGFKEINEIKRVVTGRQPPKRKWGKLYHTRRWRIMRHSHLSKNPLCVICKQLATDVDHIRRHKGDRDIFYDRRNLQSLCFQCHVDKTRAERKQVG